MSLQESLKNNRSFVRSLGRPKGKGRKAGEGARNKNCQSVDKGLGGYLSIWHITDFPCSDLTLSQDAMDAICDFYSELRGASQDNSLPVTVRCLETIIRLSTAAAKARLAEGQSCQRVCSAQ